MTPEDVAEPPVEVWPENWAAVRIFSRCEGQWRYGMSGPVGLDYSLPLALMQRMNLTDEQHEAMIDAINTMEMAALDAIYEADE